MQSARHGKRSARLASRFFSAPLAALAAAAAAALYAGCGAEPATPDAQALRRAFPAESGAVLDHGEGFTATAEGFVAVGEGSAPGALPAVGGFRQLEVELPRAGDGVIRLRTSGGFEARVREIGASGEGAIVNRAVAYQRAGRASYWTAGQDKAEEWLHIVGQRRGGAAAAWEVTGGAIEQRGDHVAIVDGSGVARLWVSAPSAYEASGRPVRTRLSGRGTTIELSVETEAEEVLIDPAWAATPPMSAAREGHTATPLPKGRVLVVGGRNGMSYAGSAEVYIPETNAWQTLQSMITGRADHAATALDNGDVLIAGGSSGVAEQSAYLFSADTDTFNLTNPMGQARARHTATRLGNGAVLIAGGSGGAASLASSEIYDPSSGSFTGTSSLSAARASHTATRLSDGRVLVAGGFSISSLASAEIYDPGTGEWLPASPMSAARQEHTATLLYDGRVLVAGGKSGATALATAEVYEPGTDAWSPAASMADGRSGHAAATLANGRVLVTGGRGGAAPIASAEMFDPVLDRWIPAGSMTDTRERHTATPLPNGKVLIAGGSKAGVALSSAELYEPLLLGTPCSAPSDCLSGFCADGVCCKEECAAGPCDACSVAAGSDSDGACKLLDGATCDDENGCTMTDTCQAGVCKGEGAKTCDSMGPCRVGACDPATGMCVQVSAPDYEPCNDSDLCTNKDECVGGVCKGIDVVCTAFDICHDAGVCDVLTGRCTNPEKDVCELPDDAPDPPVLPKDVMTCATSEDCSSGFCTDGVCCDAECDKPCFTCVLPGAIGTCSLQPFGMDIHHDCQSASCKETCSGIDNVAANMDPCVEAEAEAECSPSECFEDGFHGAGPAVCSAKEGECPTGDRVPFNCSPYRCISAIGACSSSCETPQDCAPAFVCNPDGECVLPPSISSGYVTSCAFAPPAAPEGAGGHGGKAREIALSLLIAGLSLARRRRHVSRSRAVPTSV
jgi:hypothetical protein